MIDCVSLETARKLKAGGWPQRLLLKKSWYYTKNQYSLGPYFLYINRIVQSAIAAPTIGDLLEVLSSVTLSKLENSYQAWWVDEKEMNKGNSGNNVLRSDEANPANALAMLWLSLKEKGLI